MPAGRHVDLPPARVIAPGREVDIHFEYVAAPTDRVHFLEGRRPAEKPFLTG
jgi:hypothetical protein